MSRRHPGQPTSSAPYGARITARTFGMPSPWARCTWRSARRTACTSSSASTSSRVTAVVFSARFDGSAAPLGYARYPIRKRSTARGLTATTRMLIERHHRDTCLSAAANQRLKAVAIAYIKKWSTSQGTFRAVPTAVVVSSAQPLSSVVARGESILLPIII